MSEGNMADARKQLEKKLTEPNRPDKQELLDQGILKSKLDAPLQAKAVELEWNQLHDKLEKKLERRPSKEALEQQGILQASNVAPALAGAAVELESKFAQHVLKHELQFKEGQQS